MKLSAIKTDSARVEQGEWIGDLPEMDDLELRVRGIANADYRRLQAKLIQAVPFKRRRNGLAVDDADRIQARCLLETVLLDWRGMVDDDGAPIAYSRDLAETLLSDPDFRAFRDAVVVAATRVGDDDAEGDEALEKNSETSSAGA